MNRKQVRMLRVIDGDTIEVLVRRGPFRQARKDRIRLYGIDAPETSQAEGNEASTPACFFAEPCGGYRMAKGEGPGEVNNIVAAWNGGFVGKSEGPGTLP